MFHRRVPALLGAGAVVFFVLIFAFGGGATEDSVPDRTTTTELGAGSDQDDIRITGDLADDAGTSSPNPAPGEDSDGDGTGSVGTADDCDERNDEDEPSSLCGATLDDNEGREQVRFSDLPTITLDELPPEAIDTLLLIEDGGPYPYRQDDGIFQNREGILPDRQRGHYREYTVETPGSRDRGARRIVAGADGERYWTDDHYASFSEIVFD